MANPILEGLRGQPITSPTILNNLPSYSPKSSFNMSGLLAGLGGALIGGIGSIFSQHSQNKFNAQQAALNRQFIADENAKAFDRNWNQMVYQNDYNSPANQRKLYEEAGINYQNIVGGASGTSVSKSGNAASPSGGASTTAGAPLQMEWANNIANIGLIDAQRKKTLAEAGAIEHQNNLTDSQAGYYGVLSAGQELQNGITEKYGSLEAFARVNNLEADTAFKDAQRFLTYTQDKLGQFDLINLRPAQQADYISRVLLANSQDLLNRANAAKSDAERISILRQLAWNIAYTKSAIALNYQNIAESRSRTLLNYGNYGLIGKQGSLLDSQIGLNNSLSKESGSRYELNLGAKNLQDIHYNQAKSFNDKVWNKSLFNMQIKVDNDYYRLMKRYHDSEHQSFWNSVDEFSNMLHFGASYDFTPRGSGSPSVVYLPPQ